MNHYINKYRKGEICVFYIRLWWGVPMDFGVCHVQDVYDTKKEYILLDTISN